MNIPSAQHLQQQIQKQFVTPDIERQRREIEQAMSEARPYHFTHHQVAAFAVVYLQGELHETLSNELLALGYHLHRVRGPYPQVTVMVSTHLLTPSTAKQLLQEWEYYA